MAESLHSTPTAITYGENDTKVVVGTNDGLLRMIDAENGTEDWAFLPPALFGIQADLRLNGHALDEDPLLRQHIYGIDGTPAVWVKESSNTVRLFVGMRRGGTKYYALNVTNPTNQLPELMWVIDGRDSATDLDYSVGFANLGQTWSTPSPVKVQKGYCEAANAALDNGACIALLMGGGYDPLQDELEDTDGDGKLDIKHYRQASNIGNAVYMVHALSGRLLWWASSANGSDLQLDNMSYPISSDLTVLDTDGEGSVDRVYVADLAGQVWRIDLLGQREDSSGTYIDYSRGDRLANLASDSNAAINANFSIHRRGYTRNQAMMCWPSPVVIGLTRKPLEVCKIGRM
jgi:type IV pilus assembly protein PilY1